MAPPTAFAVTYTQSSSRQWYRLPVVSETTLMAFRQLNTLEALSRNDRKACAILLTGEALRYQLAFKEKGQQPLSFDLSVHKKAIRMDIDILMQETEARTPRHHKPPKREKDNYFFLKTELALLRMWDIHSATHNPPQ